MAIKYEVKWFGKTGKGLPQAEQVDEDGKPLFVNAKGVETSTDTGKRSVGNEQFNCNQLTADSLDAESTDSLLVEALEVAGNDAHVLRQMLLIGANRYFREQASGTDEATKTARFIQKTLPALAGGLSTAELAQAIRDGRLKLS